MSKILFSINPQHVENILNGNKKVEYRKVKCAREDIDSILIYSTAPIKKVVAQVQLENIFVDNPDKIWDRTKNISGITREFFNNYFDKRAFAVAYELGEVETFTIPKSLKDFGIAFAPQSFVYVD